MKPSTEQLARMSRLLDEVLDLDEKGRLDWLEALRPENQDLKERLWDVLFPPGTLGLEAPPERALAGATPAVDAFGLKSGDRVGQYVLSRKLGQGGMAEVWLAADPITRRNVALKLPMLSRRPDMAERFARECVILARLEHPNIARLYHAGISAEGLPYMAMEVVFGQPLMQWCDEHQLDIRERLNLFQQVLEAVHYAHGHQVIHRDIKPSNVLVNKAGVWLLDFGVAKLLAGDEEQPDLTHFIGRALTPDYAAPELARGEAIGPPTDVYSLGIVLYELLCGSRPYRLGSSSSLSGLEQAILNTRVEAPSTKIAPLAAAARSTSHENLTRQLRGQLDAIVLRALAKAPDERYGSVAALTDELQRYLSGEPARSRITVKGDFEASRLRWILQGMNKVVLLLPMLLALLMPTRWWSGPRHTVGRSAPRSVTITSAGVATKERSIAVLPFLDMSQEKDNEYFSDGLSEELILRLSQRRDLRVISRTSSFYFKGRQATAAEIAQTLKVAHILEGSVRKSGNVVRIVVRLVKGSDGSHLWSQTYHRHASDIFGLQDEISQTVAQALVGPGSLLDLGQAMGVVYGRVLGDVDDAASLVPGRALPPADSSPSDRPVSEEMSRRGGRLGGLPIKASLPPKSGRPPWADAAPGSPTNRVSTDAEARTKLPQTVGKYQILGPLGKGAMGFVYKALDPDLQRTVALKTIRKELLLDDEETAAFLERFRNEAHAAGRLHHPAIVAVYEYGEEGQFAFIAMEYVEGSTLREYFQRKVRFEEGDVIDIMAQLLDALRHAHDQGVWHRDIKPSNIIMMGNSRIKLADFGVARVENSTLKEVGAVMGTPGFIAPEQYLGRDVDHRVDIFAAGVVLYELLTGETPFSGSKEGVMYKVCHETVKPPSVVAGKPELARFDAVVLRALAKSPQDRYPSAQEFRAGLIAAFDGPIAPSAAAEDSIRDASVSEPPAETPVPVSSYTIELARVERSLAHFVGPVAGALVRRAAREAKDFSSLISALSEYLQDPAERAQFVQQNAQYELTRIVGLPRIPATQSRVSVDEDAALPPQLRHERLAALLSGDFRLAPSESARFKEKAPDTEAYGHLLHGNYLFNRNTKEALENAILSYGTAVYFDSSYALAWTKLAGVKIVQAERGWASIEEVDLAAREAVRRALKLDPNLAEAHKVLGKISEIVDWDWATARAEYQRALELDAGDLETAHCLAHVKDSIFGRLDPEIHLMRRMLERDPLDAVTLQRLAWTLARAGHLQESGGTFRSLLKLNPAMYGAHAGLSRALLYMGRLPEARAVVEKEPDDHQRLSALAVVNWAMGKQGESDAVLVELKRNYATGPASDVADIHAYRGEVEDAFDWLDRAYRQHDSNLRDVRTNPLLRNLHADARYRSFLAKMKLDGDLPA